MSASSFFNNYITYQYDRLRNHFNKDGTNVSLSDTTTNTTSSSSCSDNKQDVMQDTSPLPHTNHNTYSYTSNVEYDRNLYLRVGKHDAAIDSLISDSKRHSDAMQELFSITRKTAENVCTLSASLAAFVEFAKADHERIDLAVATQKESSGEKSVWRNLGSVVLVVLGWLVAGWFTIGQHLLMKK